jgi:hypothetical protein
MSYYNETNMCDRCGYNLELGPGHPGREYVDKKPTGKWLCEKCRISDRRKRPDHFNNLIKASANVRLGTEDPDSPRAKGRLYESVTCKVRKLGNLNEINDNYNSPIDHTRDPILGIIDSQGRTYDPYFRCWKFTRLNRLYGKKYDNIICYCADGHGNIMKMYIFPKKEIDMRDNITIYNSDSPGGSWCDKYEIDVDAWMRGEIKYLNI